MISVQLKAVRTVLSIVPLLTRTSQGARYYTPPLVGLLQSETSRRDLSAQQRSKILKMAWAAAVVVLFLALLLLIVGSNFVFSSPRPGIVASTLLGAVFVGFTGLLFLSSKVIAALFGGVVGTSLSEVSGAAGLISQINEQVLAVASVIDESMPGDPLFTSQMVWLFFIVIAALWLFPFFASE